MAGRQNLNSRGHKSQAAALILKGSEQRQGAYSTACCPVPQCSVPQLDRHGDHIRADGVSLAHQSLELAGRRKDADKIAVPYPQRATRFRMDLNPGSSRLRRDRDWITGQAEMGKKEQMQGILGRFAGEGWAA